jgi:hypothetical protein
VLASQKVEVLSSRIYNKNQHLEDAHQTRNLHDRNESKNDIANGFRNQFDIVLADALKEETNDKLISVRTIEMYCYSRWKKKTRPEKNEKTSFSVEQSEYIPTNTGGKFKDIPQDKMDFFVPLPFMDLAIGVANLYESPVICPDKIWFSGRLCSDDCSVDLVLSGASWDGNDSYKCIIPSRGLNAKGQGIRVSRNHSKEK